MANWKSWFKFGAVATPLIGAGFFTASMVTKDLQVQALKDSDDPSKLLLDKLAGQEQFKTEDGKKQLDAIRGDTQFTTALNNAIKKDSSVAKGIVDLTSSSGGEGMDGKAFAEKLANPKDRALFTKILNKVAEKDGDEFDFKWMKEIGDSGAKKDYAKTKQLLAKGGIEDKRLDLGIMFQDMSKNPWQAIMQIFQNPKQFFATLMSAMDFAGPAQAGRAGQFFNGVSSVIEMYRPTSPEARRVIDGTVGFFNDVTGATDEANKYQTALTGARNNVVPNVQLGNQWNVAVNGQTPAATPPAPAAPAPDPRLATSLGVGGP